MTPAWARKAPASQTEPDGKNRAGEKSPALFFDRQIIDPMQCVKIFCKIGWHKFSREATQ